jgi:hypothetical protein|tara:strand:+ start:916 stop:1161 length:246 start_codon:yes stop_codon:yes gene_type:complete
MRKDLMRFQQMMTKIKNPLKKVENDPPPKFKPGTGQPLDPNVITTEAGRVKPKEILGYTERGIVTNAQKNEENNNNNNERD